MTVVCIEHKWDPIYDADMDLPTAFVCEHCGLSVEVKETEA